MNTKRKITALLLSAAMVTSLFPVDILAAESSQVTEEVSVEEVTGSESDIGVESDEETHVSQGAVSEETVSEGAVGQEVSENSSLESEKDITKEHLTEEELEELRKNYQEPEECVGGASSYAPYADINYAYSANTVYGMIRYISQVSYGSHFNSGYWGRWASSASAECGTSCISMALSYIGVNKTPQNILDEGNGQTVFTKNWGASTYSAPSLSTAIQRYVDGGGKYSPPAIHLPNYSSAGHWVIIAGKISGNTYQILDPWECAVSTMTINGTSASYTKSGSGKTDTIDRVYQWYNPSATSHQFRACIDSPTEGQVYVDDAFVGGWVLDMHGIDTVKYSINGGAQKTMNMGPREDVQLAYPGYPSGKEGFSYTIPWNELIIGQNTVTFYAYCGDGTCHTIGSRNFIRNSSVEKPIAQGQSDGNFSWTNCAGADVYELYLWIPNSDTIVLHKTGIAGTSYKVTDIPAGNYNVYVVAVNTASGKWATSDGINVTLNSTVELPVISDVEVTNVTSSGYTVSCRATDNMGVNRVQFPTWTEQNEQDDLVSSWETNSAVTGTVSGDVYTYRVKDENHNYERGTYYTDIYAYDLNGNVSAKESVHVDLQNTEEPIKSVIVNNHEYELYDDLLTWSAAKAKAEDKGGHLATVTSEEEQAVVQSLVLEGNRASYYLGGEGINNNTQFQWITGEDFSYTNWLEGQPDNEGTEPCLQIVRSGEWNNIPNSIRGDGYIVETETEIQSVSGNTTFESLHPYANHTNKQWVYEKTGAGKISLTFSSDTEVEQDKDFIYIYDENNELFGTYTGISLAGKTIDIPGAVARVKLVSDGSGTAYGFRITNVSAGKKRIPLNSISLNTVSTNMKIGDTKKLQVIFNPADTTDDTTVQWSSSRPSIATVSAGNVTAKDYGETEITARVGGFIATCKITVVSYTLSFDPANGEAVSTKLVGKEEAVGELPVPSKSGYVFAGWYTGQNGTGQRITEDTVVTGNQTLYAYWLEEKEYLDIADMTLGKVPVLTYTGEELEPVITLKNGNRVLDENADYTVSYLNNINAGNEAVMIVRGTGDFAGIQKIKFTIQPKNLSKTEINVKDTNQTAVNPEIEICDSGFILEEATDYNIKSVLNNNKTGKATVVIAGNGNYTGEVKKPFNVYASDTMLAGESQILVDHSEMPAGGYVYTGKAIKPAVTVEDADGNEVSKKNYKVSYKNNKNAGVASIIIQGRGKQYKGKAVYHFTIRPIDITEQYSVLDIPDKTYTGSSIRPAVKVQLDGSKKKLKVKSQYTVSYTNNVHMGNAATVTVTAKGNYSGTLTKTFKILETSFGKGFKMKGLKTVKYTGSAVKPEISIIYKGRTLKENRDYTLSCSNNLNRGKAVVTITAVEGSGFKGSMSSKFTIK